METLEWEGSNSVAMAHFLGVSLDKITAFPLNNALVLRTPEGEKLIFKVGEEVPKEIAQKL